MPVTYQLQLLNVRPEQTMDRQTPPSDGYDDLHRLACFLLEGPGNPRHHAQQKPFSVGPLRPGDAPGQAVWRLTWLRDAPGHLLSQQLAHSRSVRLGSARIDVAAVHGDLVAFRDLFARSSHPARRYDFSFVSPTYFSRSGRDYLLPDPQLLLRRLAARWNAAVGGAGDGDLLLTEDPVRDLLRRVVVVSHDLRTVRVTAGGSPRSGFVGKARLGLVRAPPNDEEGMAARVFRLLCEFAPYCGIGAQTTRGLGAVLTREPHG